MAKFYFLFYFILLILSKLSVADEINNVEINADQFTHDRDSKRIFATGNVEVIDKKFKIYAQNIFYNIEKKIISGEKDIKIFLDDGTILKTEKIILDDKFENGKFSKSYVYFPDKFNNYVKRYDRLAANSYERRQGVWETFRGAVFSACDICFDKKKNKFMDPLIQLKSKKIVHDINKQTFRYYDVFLELSGKKILYLPYFSHASPSVRRKSGFLAPSFEQNSFLGNSFEIPYYIAINDQHDLTLKPRFSTKKNPVAFLEHRKNFKNGEIFSEISGTISEQNVNVLKKHKNRGHILSKGNFDINNFMRFGYKIHRSTDRNYLQAYKYRYEDVLDSQLNLEAFNKFNFYRINSRAFQDLRPSIDKQKTPFIAPRISANLNSSFNLDSWNYNTNIEILNIQRNSGTQLNKIFISHNSQYPFLFEDGSLLEFGMHLNIGGYKIQNYNDPLTGVFKENYFRSQIYPQATLSISKPFYKINKGTKKIIEPRFFFVGGANDGNDLHIPNEDSQNFDLDTSDLFNKNRLSGTDRVDNGSRVDYGINYVNQNLSDNSLTSISIGQSFRLKKEAYASSNSGSNNYFSNIVGNIKFMPFKKFTFKSMFSIKSKNGALSYAVSDANIGDEKNSLTLSHLLASKTEGIETFSIAKRNQVGAGFSSKINDEWQFNSSTYFDLIDKIKFLNWNTKIIFENECFGFSFNWNRQYTYNKENPTSNNFMFKLSLKKIMENDL